MESSIRCLINNYDRDFQTKFQCPCLYADDMPIIVKDYTWRQTQDLVIVRVPLRGVPTSKVDLFTTDTYIKAHFSPYLFEACLYERIDENWSRCVLAGNEAIFELKKIQPSEKWPCLSKDLPRDKLMEIKKEAIERAHQKAEEEKQTKSELRNKKQKAAVKEQIGIDTKFREGIEKAKKQIRDNATKEIELWKGSRDYDAPKSSSEPKVILQRRKNIKEKTSDSMFDDEDVVRVGATEALGRQQLLPKVPEPRRGGSIEVTFTPRAFPTPSRESKEREEQEWLKKQAEARRATGFVAEDLRPEENDPQWLLDKGESFYKVGNYLGAISAFTHAISLADKMPELYAARSRAQLAVGNYRRVVRDTSTVLELCKPEVEGNAGLRFGARVARGKALLGLRLPRAAEEDLEAAVRLRPSDPEAKALLYKAELEDDPPPEDLPARSYIDPADLE